METQTKPRTTQRQHHEQHLDAVAQRLIDLTRQAQHEITPTFIGALNDTLMTLNATRRGSRNVKRNAQLTSREQHRRNVDQRVTLIHTLTDALTDTLLAQNPSHERDDALSITAAIIRRAAKIGYR